MKAPKIPSFFKTVSPKAFKFNPRYYNKKKERKKILKKDEKSKVKFRSNHTQKREKGSWIRIVFLIIILSLLSYVFIIN